MAANNDIRRTLKLVMDGIDDVPHLDEAARRNLRRHFGGMRDILTRLPAERSIEAEMVADQAMELMTAATQNRHNRTLIQS